MAHAGRARGEMGRGHQRAVWGCTGSLFGSLKNLTTGLIWLVTRVGGWGEAWGGGPWRAGKGGDGGGGTREQCGSNKRCTGSLKNLTTGGEMGGGEQQRVHGGHQRAVWEQRKGALVPALVCFGW